MSRQRTINDAAFWRSPKMAGRTQEDRATLTYLLTSPFSNIIGAYQIVPRIAASEMGWDTESQLIPVLQRLQEAKFIEYDAESSFIWVKTWWDHNSPVMAMAPKLRQKTLRQIQALPKEWSQLYIEDLLQWLPDNKELRSLITGSQALPSTESGYPIDRVSEPYPYPSDRVPLNTNTNYKSNSNPNVGVPEPLKQLSTDEREKITSLLLGVPDKDARDLLEELAKAMARKGQIKQSPEKYFLGILKNYRNGKFAPANRGVKPISEVTLEHLRTMMTKPSG